MFKKEMFKTRKEDFMNDKLISKLIVIAFIMASLLMLNTEVAVSSIWTSIGAISPDAGRPGDIVNVLIQGKNTNFRTNKTAVLICNDDHQVIASAVPGDPTVSVLTNDILAAQLNILQSSEGLNVIGIWDVKVITDLGGCPEVNTDLSLFCSLNAITAPDDCELVIAKDAFTISQSPVTTTTTTQPCAAEAIYGEKSEQTELLREYRDNILSKTTEGQELIKTYYKFSPTITKLLEQRPLLKNRAKAFIDSMLPGIRRKVEESDKEQ